MSFEELIIELKEDISHLEDIIISDIMDIDDLINDSEEFDDKDLKEKLDQLTNNSVEFNRKILLMLFKYVTR